MSLPGFFQNLLILLQTLLPILAAVVLVGGGIMVALHAVRFQFLLLALFGLAISYAAVQIVSQLYV
jgi:hypothetical protein